MRADVRDNDPRKLELASRRYPEMGFGERYLTEAVMRARGGRRRYGRLDWGSTIATVNCAKDFPKT